MELENELETYCLQMSVEYHLQPLWCVYTCRDLTLTLNINSNGHNDIMRVQTTRERAPLGTTPILPVSEQCENTIIIITLVS